MRTINLPILSDEGAWTPPADPDLKWISLANYAVYELLRALGEGDYQIRQIEASDASDYIAALNASVQTALQEIEDLYGGG